MKAPLVIVIDDDPGMRKALDALVRSLDYSCAVFASCEDFLASGLVVQSTCIVSDLQMSGMSGFDLAKSLNSASRPAERCPIIILSACDDESIRHEAQSAGLTLLKKPVDGDVLVSLMEEALASRHSIRQP